MSLATSHTPRLLRLGALLLMAGATLTCGRTADERFAFALVGDNPYSAEAYPKFERLIAAVNRQQDLAWVVHVGDVKAGADSCSDQELTARFRLNQRFDPPLLFTPGDNDWQDCDRPAAGGHDPWERLVFLRRLFYPEPSHPVDSAMPLDSQSSRPEFADVVENAMWQRAGIVFATVHATVFPVPEVAPERPQYLANAAAAWIREAFRRAQTSNAPALFLAMQGDPWVVSGLPLLVGRACPDCLLPRAGLEWLYPILIEGTRAFGRPVVLAVGDTHVFRVDKPLYDQDGQLVEQFTRVETFGNPNVHWVRVEADPRQPWVFTFHQQLVP